MSKTTRRIYPLLAGAAIALVSCGGNTTSSVALEISSDTPTSMIVGESAQAKASLSSVTWKGDDELVATVTSDGKITALRSGVFTLSATDKNDATKSVTSYVSVANDTKIAVTLSKKTTTLAVGSSFQFAASVANDSTNAGVGWQVNNDALATIDETGLLKVSHLGAGKLVVTAYSKANPDKYVNAVLTLSGTEPGGLETADGYSLIFEDDFLGGRLNSNNWEPMTGDGSAYDVVSGWGNEEKEFYRADNIKLLDGTMLTTAKKANSAINKGMPYTSGRIRSKGKVAYRYGRIEAKLSNPFGNGLWPAFWMLPETEGTNAYGGWPNSGEIDIMEAKGRVKYSVDGTIHYAMSDGQATYNFGTYVFPTGEDINGSHVYAVEWDEQAIRWYCDGNLFHTCDSANPWTIKDGTGAFPAPFDKAFHIIFNLAVGGNYDGNKMPSSSEVPARLKVDYVKWFQK